MLRLFEYLNATVTLGLVMQGHEDDIPGLIVDLAVDSDLAGEVDSTKSTGGYDTALAAARTWISYEWQSKGAPLTSRNTADAEIV